VTIIKTTVTIKNMNSLFFQEVRHSVGSLENFRSFELASRRLTYKTVEHSRLFGFVFGEGRSNQRLAERMEGRSIRELKSLIINAGLSLDGCVERQDLEARAIEAEAILNSFEDASSSGIDGVSRRTMQLSAYECVLVGHHEHANELDAVVVMLHGFSASAEDFVPLSESIMSNIPEKKFMFVLVQANPLPDAFNACGWWVIDLMRWLGAMQQGEAGVATLIRERPPGLAECRENMKDLTSEIHARFNGGSCKFVLSGFSQGAMTAMDTALHIGTEKKVDGVMMFSGAPIVVNEWHEQIDKIRNYPKVLITHGRMDTVLPFVASNWTKDLLTNGGLEVAFEAHNGGHDVGGPSVLSTIYRFIESLF